MSNDTEHECPACGAASPAELLESDSDYIACPECGERSPPDEWEG